LPSARTVRYNATYTHNESIRDSSLVGATPAMAAGLVQRPLTMEEFAEMVDAQLPKPEPRGAYKRKELAVAGNSN
jgi:hypothetical protein